MFKEVKEGDTVKRLLGGVVPMDMKVTEVTETLIITAGGWQFDRESGAEVDDDLQWGPAYGRTGSFLVKE